MRAPSPDVRPPTGRRGGGGRGQSRREHAEMECGSCLVGAVGRARSAFDPRCRCKQLPKSIPSHRMLSLHRLPRTEAEATDVSGTFEAYCMDCCAGHCCDSGEPGRGASLNSNLCTRFECSAPPTERSANCTRFARLTPTPTASSTRPLRLLVQEDYWLVTGRPTGRAARQTQRPRHLGRGPRVIPGAGLHPREKVC